MILKGERYTLYDTGGGRRKTEKGKLLTDRERSVTGWYPRLCVSGRLMRGHAVAIKKERDKKPTSGRNFRPEGISWLISAYPLSERHQKSPRPDKGKRLRCKETFISCKDLNMRQASARGGTSKGDLQGKKPPSNAERESWSAGL